VSAKDNPINRFYVNSITTSTISIQDVSFEPELLFGGNNVGMVYTLKSGKYTKLGNCIIFSINIQLSNKGTSVGGASVMLPVEMKASTMFAANLAGADTFINIPVGGSTITGLMIINQNDMILFSSPLVAGPPIFIDDTHFTNGSGFIINGIMYT